MTNEHTVFEGDVAAQLGLSRAVMRQLRESIPLVHGMHWKRGSNNRIYLKPAGIELVQAAIDSAAENMPPFSELLARVRSGISLRAAIDSAAENMPPTEKANPALVEDLLAADLSENSAPREAACVAEGGLEGGEVGIGAKVDETGQNEAVLPSVAQKKAPWVVKPRVVAAQVLRQTRNRFILECTSDEVEGVLRVRVRDNRKWRAGMRLRVREPLGYGAKVWMLEGRSPRGKGQM